MADEAPLTTEQIKDRLRVRFPKESHATFTEVEHPGGRRCDMIGFSLWYSAGHELHGFEIKASRSDWLRELKDPSKASAMMQYCDRWWLVAGSKAVVKDMEEIPLSWGFLIPRGDGLHAIRKAPKLHPMQLTRPIIASILRRAQASSARIEEIKAARAEAILTEKEYHKQQLDRLQEHVKSIERDVHEFERASGIRIRDGWTRGKDIGAALRAVLSGDLDTLATHLEGSAKSTQRSVDALLAHAATIRAAAKEREAIISQERHA